MWLPLLVVLTMVLGCSEDDDNRSNSGTVIRFSLGNYYLMSEKCWIIVSDRAGNVLDQRQLQNASTYTFDLPADREGDAVTLTIVQNTKYTEGGSSSIVSYTDVLPGDYSLEVPVDFGGSKLGEASLTLLGDFRVDDPLLNWVIPGGGSTVSYTPDNTGLRFQFSPIQPKIGFLTLQKTQPYRYLYAEVEVGHDYERTAADFKNAGKGVVSTASGTLENLRLLGKNALGEFPYYYINRPLQLEEGTIELPMIPEVSDTVILEFYMSDDTGREYNTRITSDQFPTSLARLEGSIGDVVFKEDVIYWKANTLQPADGIEFHLRGNQESSKIDWLVVGAAGQQRTTLPRISKEVAPYGSGTLKEVSFTTLADMHVSVDATLVDYADYNGYQDYLVKYYLNRTDYKTQDYRKVIQMIN